MAKAIDHQEFLRRLAETLLEGAEAHARPAVAEASNTLARYLSAEIVAESPGEVIGALTVPHFWAQWAHDGRGPAAPTRTRFLVWFRNPLNDPRLRGGRYPIRRRDVRHLTEQQWKFWLNENRLAARRNVPPPMIIVQHVGPAAGTPFFSNEFPRGGMWQFPAEGKKVATLMAREHIRKAIEPYLDLEFTWRVHVVSPMRR